MQSRADVTKHENWVMVV